MQVFLRHSVYVNEMADANRVMFEQAPENWRKLLGQLAPVNNINDSLLCFGMEMPAAREAAQNRPFWGRMLVKHSAHIRILT